MVRGTNPENQAQPNISVPPRYAKMGFLLTKCGEEPLVILNNDRLIFIVGSNAKPTSRTLIQALNYYLQTGYRQGN